MTNKQLVITPALMQATLNYPEANNFLNFLKAKCEPEKVTKAISDYNIGTSARWPGATIFWQLDANKNIRTGKIAQYDKISGEIISAPREKVSWVHYEYKKYGYEAKECLYGEHLLSCRPNDPIGLVETEKSAIVASMFKPEFVWLSVGRSCNLNVEFCENLKGREIRVYPDADVLVNWSKKIKEISRHIPMTIGSLSQGNSRFHHKYTYRSIGEFLLDNQNLKLYYGDE
jgi:hypothetical protein